MFRIARLVDQVEQSGRKRTESVIHKCNNQQLSVSEAAK